MTLRSIQSRAWIALLLVAVASCASSGKKSADSPVKDPADGATPPSRVTIDGVPSELRTEARRSVSSLLDSYDSSGGEAAYVDDAAYELELFLRAQGYATATTSYEIDEERQARIDVRAGGRSIIGKVSVDSGDGAPIDKDDLERYVNGPTTGLFGGGGMLYVEGRVQRAPDLVVSDLIALGHLDAEARVETDGATEVGGPVDVLLVVRAGPRYTVRSTDLRLVGEGAQDDGVREHVERALSGALNGKGKGAARFEPRLPGRIRGGIRDALARRGRPDAAVEVEADVNAETREVDLAIRVDPGPYVIVDEIRVEGNTRSRSGFLKKRLRIKAGQPYDSRRIREAIRRLYRTGVFSEIRPRLEGEGSERALVVEVVEQPSFDVYFEPGFGSYELFRATVGAEDRNLFGRNIRGLAEVTAAVRALRARVRLTDPFLIEDLLIGDLEVEYERRQEPSFLRETAGIGAFVTREWNRITSTSLGYRFGRSDARDVQAESEALLEVQQAVNIGAVTLLQWYDTRNAIIAPSEGTRIDGSMELALDELGAELNFLRTRVTWAWHRPFGERNVLAVGVRTGVIVPIQETDIIPIQERFFAGGENSVRSFRESQLGPKSLNGEPVGGEAFTTASIEWRRELIGALQGAAFFDAGYVEPFAEDWLDPRDVRYGIGAGLRYILPIGPIRLDGAVNPDARPGESEWVVHFSIGMPF
ncbi:MAG: BamA/TamA family outer membrane protein [Planctomycetota bacterium]